MGSDEEAVDSGGKRPDVLPREDPLVELDVSYLEP